MAHQMKPTMKDVARLAHVSTATVSNVMTGKKFVSEQYRESVFNAMKALDYIPNQAARSLRKNRSRAIGVVVPDIINPFFGKIINAIASYANNCGYHLLLGNYNNDTSKQLDVLNALLKAGTDGIIYVSPRIDEADLNVANRVPLVLVDRTRFVTEQNIGFVFTNNYLGGSLAAERFLKRGFDKYICIAGIGKKGHNAVQRVEGFSDTLSRNGVCPEQIAVYNCELTFEFQSVYERVQLLLEDGSIPRNSAMFVCSDLGAWGAMEALKQVGLRIPEDVGVIGYDNIVWAEWFVPKLTTVENSQSGMGERAAEMLIAAIEREQQLDGQYSLLDVRLVERGSV